MIDEELFNAGGKYFHLCQDRELHSDLREFFGAPELLQNMETLVKRIPDIEEKIAGMNARMKKFSEMREQLAAKAAGQ